MRAQWFRVLAAVSLTVAALALPWLAARAEAAVDPGQRGPYAVGFTSFILADPSRPGDSGVYAHRPIPVYVWYPVDAGTITESTPGAVYPLEPLYTPGMISTSSDWEKYGVDAAYQEATPSSHGPFPLVMFSPGWGGPAWLHMSVGTRLASHGFVVAVLYHFGDQWWPWEPLHHLALSSWDRPRDMSFALSDLLATSAGTSHLLHGLIDPNQVAAGGFSLGGYAAIALAGGDDLVCDFFLDNDPYGQGPPPPETCTPSFPDPRFKAIVPLDGSNQIFKFQELARVTVPAMGMGEEWNMVGPWQARQHLAFSGNPNYRIDVLNTSHDSFSGDECASFHVLDDLGYWSQYLDAVWGPASYWLDVLCTPYTPTTEVNRLTGKYMVAFLKTVLLGETGYQSILTPGWSLNRGPLIEFFVTEKGNANAVPGEGWAYGWFFMHQPGNDQASAEKDPTMKRPIQRVGPGGSPR